VLNKKYVVYLIITLVSVLMLESYVAFSDLAQVIEDKKLQMQRTLSDLENEKKSILKLKEEVRKLKIKPLSREEALKEILDKADYFVKMYDATVKKSLSEKDNIFFITVSFDYYPESSEDLIKFFYKLSEITSPQLVIENFRLDNLKEGTKTYFEITLKQPFKGK